MLRHFSTYDATYDAVFQLMMQLMMQEVSYARQLALFYLLSIKSVLQSRKVPKYFDQWFS